MKIIGITGDDEKSAGSGKDTVANILVNKYGFARMGISDVFKRFLASVFLFSHAQLWGSSSARNWADDRYGVPWMDTVWLRAWNRFWRNAPSFLLEIGLGTDRVALNSLHDWFMRLMLDAGGAGYTGETIPLSVRQAAQILGTEWGRARSETLWIDYLRKQVHALKEPGAWYDPEYGVGSADEEPIGAAVRNPKGIAISDCRYANEIHGIHEEGGIIIGLEGRGDPLPGKAGAHPSEHGLAGTARDFWIRNDGPVEDTERQIERVMHQWTREAA